MMKLTTKQKEVKAKEYLAVRKMYGSGEISMRDLAKFYNKSYQWVSFVVKGKGIRIVEELNLPDLTE